MRIAKYERKTKETQVSVDLNLDGTGKYEVSTGIGFLDHMLEQLSRHSLIDLKLIKQTLDDQNTNPRDLKRRLARELVALYHNEEAAQAAQDEFDRIFVKKDLPDEIPELAISVSNDSIGIVELLTEAKLVASKSEARRMIDQGGVSVDGNKIDDDKAVIELHRDVIIKVGKRKFLKVSKV